MNLSTTFRWRTPEELVTIGLQRSRVVMTNEAHDGLKRCIRTRLVGQRILLPAHQMGVRYLAMEALYTDISVEANRTRQLSSNFEGDYLSQPEMHTLVQKALDLGWTLVPYDLLTLTRPPEDPSNREFINWRQEEGARALSDFMQALPFDARLLVWSGWAHPYKNYLGDGGGDALKMMGYQFQQMSGIEPFVIDQVMTVHPSSEAARMLEDLSPLLETMGGTAGFLKEEAPDEYKNLFETYAGVDGFLLSIHNTLE